MKKISMTNVSLVITLRCTLQCKLCTAFAPYYDNPPHYPLEMLKKSVDRYFDVVEYVNKFTINGGEAFLHEGLPELLNYIAENYLERIGVLEILTNGTIAPKDKLLESMKNISNLDILVNDYGENLSKKIQEIINILQSNNIKYRLREQNSHNSYCGGWVDISDLSFKNRSKEATQMLYSKCVYPTAFRCFAIFGDKAYICGVYLRCKSTHIISDNNMEYVDFSDNNTLSREEMIERIKKFFDKPFSSCEYCNGFCPDSKRFLPAEQL